MTDRPATPPSSATVQPLALSALLSGDTPLDQLLAQTEDRIRREPRTIAHRWFLFELLCVLGDWTRALKQLQVCAQLDLGLVSTAHVYRDLVRAESFRAQVFEGKRTPGFALTPPAWVDGMLQALQPASAGAHEAADTCRAAALDVAPLTSGATDKGSFGWITDSDSRLGPICELVAGGHYRWIPFCQLTALTMQAPTRLLDLVWSATVVVLADGTTLRGYLPVRYVGTEWGSDVQRLARETSWSYAGSTGVIGCGQRTWLIDGGDVGLLDVRTCQFNPSTVATDETT